MSKGKDCGSSCVRDVIAEIIKAQDEVAGMMDNGCCDVSCERSIRDLLSPTANVPSNTTVPFILNCKDCKPFIGSGVISRPLNGGGTFLDCLQSPIFRAKKFVDNDKYEGYGDHESNCVKLELLIPVTMGGSQPGPSGKGKQVCDYFPGNSIRNLRATGVCITVDLDCFCSITCLEPTTPLMATREEMNDAMDKFNKHD
ncbi:spore coat protein Z [Halobacillus karajensis]|uniref:Spore coat protein Y n=1 Tax=Halobacillus karajensis TaxID=195088 RepID=A0A024P5H4_9BACI|nr:CotY/CotZ family spore coat protein [Halobacillus karajensis]CDQ20503.1 Spore coat protein Y [Halobacillus karajensis]CDQ24028.1 Spore coat protein Y [Halobacillus karajensis]CDQ27506.1 Spore coat protein Y [Halobacillus karajensis]SEH90771.1 spore coat protein Z [Halobacillus karajensis]